jgi:head-tail adaptor
MLAAGRLNERIAVRRQQDVADGVGGFTRVWAPVEGFERIWAEVIGINGRESVIQHTLQGVATYRITIRFPRTRPFPRVNDQIVWRGLELNIIAPPIDPNGRREALQIMADTSTPQGA